MIKILHSADWHLDSPLSARDEALRNALLEIPGKLADLVRQEGCDLVLLAGDLFDGVPSRETVDQVSRVLEEMAVPVFISPGNHDYVRADSPWLTHLWPENVHIFTQNTVTSLALPALDCRVYGAAFTGMDCPALLEEFHAEGAEHWQIAVLHGDPQLRNSPYCPITQEQILNSGLDYLALGHIHKTGQLRVGQTLCAWPGCPMGRGYDETGEKGVYIVTLGDTVETEFRPLALPRFYDLTVEAGSDPEVTLNSLLPSLGNNDYYRITLTGECPGVDLPELSQTFARFPNLVLRDRTVPPVDLWANAGADTLEGVYFQRLQEALSGADEDSARQIRLAAKLSRKLLDGQEVTLP